jgi:hypothetical protein
VTGSPTTDHVRAAGDRRRLIAEFDLQDRALTLRESGLSNREVGATIGLPTPVARRLCEVAERRRASLAGVVPHPDPSSLALTEPETDLMRAVLDLQLARWRERDVAAPATTSIGPRVGRARHWATACAHRRIDCHLADGKDGLGLTRCSNNAYLALTQAGWGVALAMWPEAFEGIPIPDASLRPSWAQEA